MKIWVFFLGAYLVLEGLFGLMGLSFKYDQQLQDLLALVAGVLVLMRI